MHWLALVDLGVRYEQEGRMGICRWLDDMRNRFNEKNINNSRAPGTRARRYDLGYC